MALSAPLSRETAEQEYSQEERQMVIQYFMNLKGDLIREFLENRGLPKSGTKPKLRERILEWIEEGTLLYRDLVALLDSLAPWGKQHIFLYRGPESSVVQWRENDQATAILRRNNLLPCLNSGLPLILPPALTISSIGYDGGEGLKIYAVERREQWVHTQELDRTERTSEDTEIRLKAFLHIVTRGVMLFRWNLVSNSAVLQVSQLPSESRYEQAEDSFTQLINPWLDMSRFEKIDLRPVIQHLHESEGTGNRETRSHSMRYRTPGGRSVSAQSPTPQDSVLGEQELDALLSNVRMRGTAHIGNFYWLSSAENPSNANPLVRDVHTVIVGDKSRINFTTPNRKEDVEYVLSRVHHLSH